MSPTRQKPTGEKPTGEEPIRPARPGEADAIRGLVERAYTPWVELIGRRPAPMDDDYEGHVAHGEAFVLPKGGTIAAVAVLIRRPDHLLVDNVAVDPGLHGQGLGQRMLRFAEDEARRLGLGELRLFSHARMESNIRLYGRFGFRITHRATVDGFDRVFMAKAIARA